MTMLKRCWTDEQKNAILAKNGAVLVSAAAGSGKTAVLVERVIRILTDKSTPCDVDKLLVVTFTKAAAAEMKERINARISEMLISEPENKNLQRQQLMLSSAHISTIHSFCNELIRENFYKLNMSPEFRIADENEMLILKNEVIQAVLEEKYKESSRKFLNLVEAFSSSRDDQKLISTVLTLYDFIRSHPFPQKWLVDKLKFYDDKQNLNENIFVQVLFDYARMAVIHCLQLTENSVKMIQEIEKIKLAYEETLLYDKELLNELKSTLENKNWNEISRALKIIKFVALKRLVGYSDDPVKLKVIQNRKDVKEIIKNLTRLFFQSEEQCFEDLKTLRQIISELFELVKDFEERLDLAKNEKNVVDFGDLEHLTLKLLVCKTENGFEKTEIARSLSQQFEFVMVDEYQDTNEAQDLIFRSISDDERNLFVVGDVKQSIYGFRQAMPEIFLRRKQKYKLFDANKEIYPAKIILDKNFRSRKGILGATNFIFSQLMSNSIGEIEYNQEEKLSFGASYDEKNDSDVEIKILDISESEDDGMNVLEARCIAKIIAQMIGENYEIKSENVVRPVTYGDFCILLRSTNKHAADFVKELELCGIPSWSDTSNSFFGTAEISTILSLLKIIDNPIQDIPLLAVLVSPIFGFTPDDLSEIRVTDKEVPLYFALKKQAKLGDKKCRNFLLEIDNYRRLAATLPSDKLIQQIYDKTGYTAVVQAMKEGQLRLNNLRLLIEYARNYEASGYKGLTGFIRFVSRLEEQKADIAASNSISEGANVVKIMSIHRSKGLEFPICILANCSRKFNKDVGDILLHPDLGPGIKLLDYENMRKYTTFQRDAIKLDIDKKALSEELRVLYVAMTRAKEKLIMLTSLRNPESTLNRLSAQVTQKTAISPYVVGAANSFSDWILMCALRHPNGAQLREIAGTLPEIVLSDATDLKIEILKPEEISEVEDKQTQQALGEIIDEELLDKINSRLNYVYKFDELARIPPKVTVSDLVSKNNREIKFDFAKKPAFLSEESLNSAQKGSAMHAFMQFADFKKAKINLESEIKSLLERGFVSKEQCEVLNRMQITTFLKSNLCERILASKNVSREFRFAMNINAFEVVFDIKPEFSNEKIMLQGAIDCVFEEKDNLIVVDYKTDKIISSETLKKQYAQQLELYARALRECTGKIVKEKVLYSFYTGTQIFL